MEVIEVMEVMELAYPDIVVLRRTGTSEQVRSMNVSASAL